MTLWGMRLSESPTHPHAAAKRRPSASLGRFAAYTAVACTIIAIFALCWILRDVLLIAFGAIVFAVFLRAAAGLLIKRAGLREQWAVMIVVLVFVVGAAGVSWLFGRQIAQQLQGLDERLPRAIETVKTWLEGNPAGQFVVERLSGAADQGGTSLDGLRKLAAVSAATVGHAVLMIFGGIYMAANPRMYLDGFTRLFPLPHRQKLRHAMVESGGALRHWLMGQLVSMVTVGTLTGIGLRLVGAPLPLALGILAGLLNFVPILGPIVAVVPGVLVALTDSPQTALYAAGVYFVVQELEGHVITPLIQRWAVKLPPAYGMIAVLSFGLLFGVFGVIVGVPLAVVVMCLVRHLYVKNGLEKDTAKA